MSDSYEEKYNSFQYEERYNKGNFVTEIEFNAPCPVDECINKNDIIGYTHKNCGGRYWLTSDGNLRCIKCGKKNLLIDWKFACRNNDAKYASKRGLINSLTIMAQLNTSENEQLFIAKTAEVIMRQLLTEEVTRS